MNFRDVELLSAYLDGRLSPSDSARVEQRLGADAALKAQLEELRETRGVLRRLPQRKAPRNFSLTPKMARVRPPEPRAVPIFRLATALATFLFFLSVALNGLAPLATSHLAAAPAPAAGYGMGGGGSGGGGPAETSPSAGTEAPAQPFAAMAPTATAEILATPEAQTNIAPLTQDSSRTLAAPTQAFGKAAPAPPGNALPTPQPPVPVVWVLVLGLIMIGCALAAWLVRLSNDRRIRDQWNHK